MTQPAEPKNSAPVSRTTNDPAQMERVIRSVFLGRSVSVRDQTGEGTGVIRSFEDGLISVALDRPPAEVRLLTLLHGAHLMVMECSVVSRQADGTELLRPRRLHLRPPRGAHRVAIAGNQGDTVYAVDCIPTDALPEALGNMNRKRDKVLDVYRTALREKLPAGCKVEVRLRRTQRLDPHMRAMQLTRRPIFAPQTKDPNAWALLEPGRFITFEQYGEVIRYEDEKTLQSEIAFPLWYRGLFLYGYVNVRAYEPLSAPAFEVTSALSLRMHAELLKQECLPRSEAHCTVVDISASGVGVLYPQRAGYHKAFMPGADIMIDLQLGAAERISVEGVLKNIRSLEHAHRFGIEYAPLRPEAQEVLTDFLARREETQRAS